MACLPGGMRGSVGMMWAWTERGVRCAMAFTPLWAWRRDTEGGCGA